MEEAQAAENVRLGRQDSNLVQVFDRGVGMCRPTEDGQPFLSAVAGRVYSLWIMRRLQFGGPMPLGEIVRPETPLEVFGLVPIPPAALRELPGWRASLAVPGERTPAPFVVSAIEFGRVPNRCRRRNGDLREPAGHARQHLRASEARASPGARDSGHAAPDHPDVARAAAPVALAQRRLVARQGW